MADFLKPKTASEVVRREWAVPVDEDDAPLTVSTTGTTGVTVDSAAFEGDTLVLTLSAGTAAATGSIPVSVTTDKGRTLQDTLYIPIIASAAQVADTARAYILFALRKITGVGATPQADELDDALERLNGLIAEWRGGGVEIAAPFPLTANSVIYCPDWAVNAIRYNLVLECATLYEMPVSQFDYRQAMRGKQMIMHRNLPDERKSEYF